MLRSRRRRARGEQAQAKIEMNSLIDLTFLLLVTFIVTLPAIEQGVSIMLPQGKTDKLPDPKDKPKTVSIDASNQVFFGTRPVTLDELRQELTALVKENPQAPVLVRGDERLNYGAVMDVIKVVYACHVTKMALVTEEK